MTRPMSEEREKALKVAAHVLRAEEVHGPSAVILARALLATSSAERRMREALDEIAEHPGPNADDAAWCRVDRARAALSPKGEGK